MLMAAETEFLNLGAPATARLSYLEAGQMAMIKTAAPLTDGDSGFLLMDHQLSRIHG